MIKPVFSRDMKSRPQGVVLLSCMLIDLPAELLATSYPTTSWAFDSAPTMTLQQWEKWRQTHTCRVVMTAWSDETAQALWPKSPVPRVQWPNLPNMESGIMKWLMTAISACYHAIREAWFALVTSIRLSISQAAIAPFWRRSTYLQNHLLCIEAAERSHTSDSTELRMLPADLKIAGAAEMCRRQNSNRSEESSSLIPDAPQTMCKRTKGATMRPLVVIKGCLPKGFISPLPTLITPRIAAEVPSQSLFCGYLVLIPVCPLAILLELACHCFYIANL